MNWQDIAVALVGVALPTAVGMTVCFAVHLAATWLKI